MDYVIPPPDARPIPNGSGYPDIPGILVRDGGELFSSWNCKGPNGRWHAKKASVHKTSGRLQVKIWVDGKLRWTMIHHLVLWAFKGPRPPGLLGCHNDGNYLNNYAYNLRWDTYLGNAADKWLHGTMVQGEAVNLAKLTEAQIPEIFCLAKQGLSQIEIAKEIGIGKAAISFILNRKNWKHVHIDRELLDVPLGKLKGEKANGVKITSADVIEVFRLSKDGTPQWKIAERFGLTQAAVHLILSRRNWAHVEIPPDLLGHGGKPGGSRNTSQFKPEDVVEIFRMSSTGMTLQTIGDKYGVCKSTIGRILSRKILKHIVVPPEFLPAPR